MKLVTQTRINLLIIFVFSMTAVIFLLPKLLFSDRFLTLEFQTILQRSLKSSGITIQIGNIHWKYLNVLIGTQVSLKDNQNGQTLIEANQVQLKFNPLILLTKAENPEASLQQISLDHPQLFIERYSGNTWNLQRYFKSQGRRLLLSGLLRLHDGKVHYDDYQYGKFLLQRVNGTVNLNMFPLVSWDLQGNTQLKSQIGLSCKGRFRTDQQAGNGTLTIKRGLLVEINRFIPYVFPYQIHSGWADLQLKLILAKNYFGIEKVAATVSHANISFPQFSKDIQINYLQGTITSDFVKINNAQLKYGPTNLEISGTMNLANTKLNARIDASQVNLTDWIPFLDRPLNNNVVGRVNLKLQVGGNLKSPKFNGEIKLDKVAVMIKNGDSIEQISGQINIIHNDVYINHLQGIWHTSVIELSGRVIDILNPRLHLKLSSNNLDFQEINWLQPINFDIKTGKPAVFSGEITGSISNPNFNGKISMTILFTKRSLSSNC